MMALPFAGPRGRSGPFAPPNSGVALFRSARFLILALAFGARIPTAFSGEPTAWAGQGADDSALTPENWSGAFSAGATTDITFGATTPNEPQIVLIPGSLALRDIAFIDETRPNYTFTGTDSPTLTLHGNVSSVAGGDILFQNSLALALAGSDHTLTAADGVTFTIQGVISGSANVTKNGGGTLVLSGANIYTGRTTIAGGYLSISSDGNLGAVPEGVSADHLTIAGALAVTETFQLHAHRGITLSGGASFNIAHEKIFTVPGEITGSGGLNMNPVAEGAGTLHLSGDNDYTGVTTIHEGTIRVSHANALGSTGSTDHTVVGGSGTLELDNVVLSSETIELHGALLVTGTSSASGAITLAGTPTIGGTGSLTLSGNVDGDAPLTKTGTGALTLSGTNAYTGGTVLGDGTLSLGSSDALGTSGTISFTGGTLQYGTANTVDYSSRFSTAAGQNYRIDTNGQSVTFATALTSPGGSLRKFGAGTLTLSGENTYSSETIVAAGTLSDGGEAILPSSTAVFVWAGATLALASDQTIDELNHDDGAGGTVTLGAGVDLTITDGGTFAGTITGAGKLVVTGSGLTLRGDNDYGGGTDVSGSLRAENAGALGTGSLTLAGGIVEFAEDNATTFMNAVTAVTGDAILVSDRRDSSSSSVTHTLGSLEIGAHTLTVSRGSNVTFFGTGGLVFGTTTLSGDATFDIGSRAALTLGAVDDLGDGFGFTKSGSGTLTLGAANTATGEVTANAGTITLAHPAARGSGAWTFNNSSVLKLGAADNLTGTSGDDGIDTIFNHSTVLNATVVDAISGGNQIFHDDSVLEVTAPGTDSEHPVITNGEQTFFDLAQLKAQKSHSITGGTQNFYGGAALVARADDAVAGGTQNFADGEGTVSLPANLTSLDDSTVGDLLKNTARLTINNSGSVSGGEQNFSGSSSLQANTSQAVVGGTQNFSGISHLRASRSHSITGGSQTFDDNSFLWVRTVDEQGEAVSGGQQSFRENAKLVADTPYAVTGGTQHFTDQAGAFANASQALYSATITLEKDSFIEVGANEALGHDASVHFDANKGGLGGTLTLNGHDATIGRITSTGGGGVIQNNGESTATLTLAVYGDDAAFGGMIHDGADSAPLALVKVGSSDLTLSGSNSYTGGTTLDGGTLLLGSNQALGIGELAVTADAALATTTDVELHNPVSIENGSVLTIGQEENDNDLALKGPVYGSTIDFQGAGQLALAGPFWLDQLNVNAAPGGSVVVSGSNLFSSFFEFEDLFDFNGMAPQVTLNSGSLTFETLFSAVNGFSGAPGTQVVLGSGSNLTFARRWFYEEYGAGDGAHEGTISGSGSLRITDDVRLTLTGDNTFSGGTTLHGRDYYFFEESPTLELGHDNALGTGALEVTGFGGTLRTTETGAPLEIGNNILINTPWAYEFDEFFAEIGLLIEGSFDFTLSGAISGSGGIQKWGVNKVTLSGDNSFHGASILDGTLEFTHDNAAGLGPLLVGGEDVGYEVPPTAIFTTAAPVIHGLAGYESAAVVQLADDSTLTIDQDHHTEFLGSIVGSAGNNNAQLLKTGHGLLLLAGTNTYSGGTTVNGGGIVFGAQTSIPSSTEKIKVGADGYVGTAFSPTTNIQSDFIDQFDKPNTHGSIGFDSATSSYSVTTPISLAGFASDARLGSATFANIGSAATITPQETTYRFGGGGGYLEVASPLIDESPTVSRSLVVDSPETAPLTLRLDAPENVTLTGGVAVTHSALIFAAGSLPSGDLTLGTGGYVGTEDTAFNADAAAFLSRFSTTTTETHGIVGFDRDPLALGGPREIAAAIDLSDLAGQIYLGSATAGAFNEGSVFDAAVKLTGTITPADNTYRFAGYKNGAIEIAGELSGNRTVEIGDPEVLATFGTRLPDNEEEYASVVLSGDNQDLVGNTHLHAGRLFLGHANALGGASNELVVHSTSIPDGLTDEPVYPQLAANIADLQISNPISLDGGLSLGGVMSFTLAGVISGDSGLYLDDSITVTLTGHNQFAGGIYIERGTVVFDHNHAAGLGTLAFGVGDSGSAIFTTDAPVIAGLESDHSNARVFLGSGTKLEINQAADTYTVFRGDFELTSTETHQGSQIVKKGAGVLRLENDGSGLYGITVNDTSISAEINGGTVVIGPGANQPLGNNAVHLTGGTLALDHTTLDNDLITVSGTLAGNGSFFTSGLHPVIGEGMALSPGFSSASGMGSIGHLAFVDLTLASDGTYNWNLQDLGSGNFAADVVSVTAAETLTIEATSENPFTINITTLLPNGATGSLTGLQLGHTYSWTLFQAQSVSGFDAANFAVSNSTAAAAQFFAGGGTFSFSLANTSPSGMFTSSLMLNFTPVPEPSTWALMLAGGGLLAITALRRRSRSR